MSSSSSSNTTTTNQPIVTPNDYGPAVNVVTWFLGSTAVLFVIARLTTKVILAQRIRIDDGLLIVSLLFSIGLVITVSLETSLGGLGQHQSSLSPGKLDAFQKAAYAGDLLYILSLTFSKISLLMLLRLLTPVRRQIRAISSLGAAIFLWTFASLLAAAFQCHAPRVWAYIGNQCFQRVAFWNAFGVINVITEGILVMLPVLIVWNLQMPLLRKSMIIWCFAVRIFVIASAIAELVFRNRIAGSEDLTLKSWPIVVCSQSVQTLSIITACIPYLKPFFASLESGMIRADDSRRLASRSIWSDGYRRTPVQNKGSSSTMLRSLGSRKLQTWTDVPLQGETANRVDSTDVHRHHTRGSEAESQTSQSRIIVPTAA